MRFCRYLLPLSCKDLPLCVCLQAYSPSTYRTNWLYGVVSSSESLSSMCTSWKGASGPQLSPLVSHPDCCHSLAVSMGYQVSLGQLRGAQELFLSLTETLGGSLVSCGRRSRGRHAPSCRDQLLPLLVPNACCHGVPQVRSLADRSPRSECCWQFCILSGGVGLQRTLPFSRQLWRQTPSFRFLAESLVRALTRRCKMVGVAKAIKRKQREILARTLVGRQYSSHTAALSP